jgi:hypothetical protein
MILASNFQLSRGRAPTRLIEASPRNLVSRLVSRMFRRTPLSGRTEDAQGYTGYSTVFYGILRTLAAGRIDTTARLRALKIATNCRY